MLEKIIQKVQSSLNISKECAAYSVIEVARYIDLCKYLSKKNYSSWKEKLVGEFRIDDNLPVFFQSESNDEGRCIMTLENRETQKKAAFKEIAGIFYPM